MPKDGMETKPEAEGAPVQVGTPVMIPGNPQPTYAAQPHPLAQPAHPNPAGQQYPPPQQQDLPTGYVYPPPAEQQLQHQQSFQHPPGPGVQQQPLGQAPFVVNVHQNVSQDQKAEQHTTVVQVAGHSGCVCTCGWVLFGFGFFLPILWVVGAFLPLCTHEPNDYNAQKACIILLIIYIILIIIIAAT